MHRQHYVCRSEPHLRKNPKLFVIKEKLEQLNQQLQQDWEQIFGRKSADHTIHVIGCSSNFYDKLKATNDPIIKRIIFERFGNVEMVRRGCTHCCFIHCKDATAAETLLEKRQIEIFGDQFELRRCNQYQNRVVGLCIRVPPTHSPSTQAPGQDSPSHILNALNDDCLGEIFRRLDNYADFNAVQRVCVRFKDVSKKVFSLRIKEKPFHLLDFEDNDMVSQLESFSRNFGSSVYTVLLYLDIISNQIFEPNLILKLMNEHFKSLKSLDYREIYRSFHDTPVVNDDLMMLRSLLPNLKWIKLKIENEFKQFAEFISACSQLETLLIYNFGTFQLQFPDKTFPKLTELTVINYRAADESFMYDEFVQFLILNPQLETIKLDGFRFAECIGKNIINLKKFGVDTNNGLTALDVFRSKFLNENVELEIDYRRISSKFDLANACQLNGSITKFNASIECSLEPNDFVALVHKHKNVEEMRFYVSSSIAVNINTFVPMIRHAELRELSIVNQDCGSGLFKFDENDYDTILEVVKGRCKLNISIENAILRRSMKYCMQKTINFNRDADWLTVVCEYEAYHMTK